MVHVARKDRDYLLDFLKSTWTKLVPSKAQMNDEQSVDSDPRETELIDLTEKLIALRDAANAEAGVPKAKGE